MAAGCDAMLLFLHESFVAFNEVLTTEASSWDACKAKLQNFQERWQEKGLFGSNALSIVTRYQEQINWKGMAPEQFGRFYRFTFYICREPGKRNLPMDLAVSAWRLIMPGRYRLLDRWCAFAANSQARVVTEDTWRQVLEFSRIIHEDLSNYDSAGAWAVLLDEFVEDLRAASRRRSSHNTASSGANGSGDLHQHLARRVSSATDLVAMFAAGGDLSSAGGGLGGCGSGLDLGGGGVGGGGGRPDDVSALLGPSYMASISPRCGSKRREPDVDVVAEQLSAMPLGVGHAHHHPQHQHQDHHLHGADSAARAEAQGGGLQYGGGGGGNGAGVFCGNGEVQPKRPCLDRYEQPVHPSQARQQVRHPQSLLQPHHTHQQQQHHRHHHLDEQQQQQQQKGLPLSGFTPCALFQPGDPDPHPLAHPQPHQVCGGLGTATAESCGGGGGLGCARPASSGQPMSVSTGSVGSEVSQGPTGTAAMDCLQEPMAGGGGGPGGLMMLGQQPQPCQQQRRAVKARRSGLSDIVKSAVTDALGL